MKCTHTNQLRNSLLQNDDSLRDYFANLSKHSDALCTDLNTTLARLYQSQFHKMELPETRSPRAHIPETDLTLAIGNLLHSCKELTSNVEEKMASVFGRDDDLFGRIGDRSFADSRSAEILSLFSSSLDELTIQLEATGELSVRACVPEELKESVLSEPDGINVSVNRLHAFLSPYGGSAEILADEPDTLVIRAILRVDFEGVDTTTSSREKLRRRERNVFTTPGTNYTLLQREIPERTTPYRIMLLSDLLETDIGRQRVREILSGLDSWVADIPEANEIFIHSQEPNADHDIDIEAFELGQNARITMSSEPRDVVSNKYQILTNIVDHGGEYNILSTEEDHWVPSASALHFETDEEGLRSNNVRNQVSRLRADHNVDYVCAYSEPYQTLSDLYNIDRLQFLEHTLESMNDIANQACSEQNIKSGRLRTGIISVGYQSMQTGNTLAVVVPAFKIYDQDSGRPVTEAAWNLDESCFNYWPIDHELNVKTAHSIVTALRDLNREDPFFGSTFTIALRDNGVLIEDQLLVDLQGTFQDSDAHYAASSLLNIPRVGLFHDPTTSITKIRYLQADEVRSGKRV